MPFEWQEAVIRAAITLKLCSFEETGAIVAALTTSIPEAPNTARNWDYRFCWLRDAYFVVHALNRLGATKTMEDFLAYITNLAALEPTGTCKPVYGDRAGASAGRSVTSPSLAGYRGMGPVRVGNLADEQVQNDVYGSVILAAAQIVLRPPPAAHGRRRAVRAAGADRRAGRVGGARARCRAVGVPRPRARPHLFGGDVLGGLRPPARASPRSSAWPERAAHWRDEADAHPRARSSRGAWNAEREQLRRQRSAARDLDASRCC